MRGKLDLLKEVRSWRFRYTANNIKLEDSLRTIDGNLTLYTTQDTGNWSKEKRKETKKKKTNTKLENRHIEGICQRIKACYFSVFHSAG